MKAIFTVFLLAIVVSLSGANEVCAGKFSELSRSARLSALRPLFNDQEQIAMVNETKGSFVVIESIEDELMIRFYTSGIFDLYPIRREGPLRLCDTGRGLRMVGLGREEDFEIVNKGFRMGKGGPRQNFSYGEMPELLRRLHRMDARGLASER